MRGWLRMGGVLVALGVLVLAARSWSAPKPQKQEPRTRIALLNLHYVIKHYDKYKNFQEEMKKVVAPYQEKDQRWRKEAEKLAKSLNDPKTLLNRREERNHGRQ